MSETDSGLGSSGCILWRRWTELL